MQEEVCVDLAEHKLMPAMGGRIWVAQCTAKSKRSGRRCRGIAMKPNRKVCYFHGGASTGPTTIEGRRRCAEAKTVHGRETRLIRAKRSSSLAGLRELEQLAFGRGLMVGGRTPGRKPANLMPVPKRAR